MKELKQRALIIITFIVGISGQGNPTFDIPIDFNIDDLEVRSSNGLCYSCLYQNSSAMYIKTAPQCTIKIDGVPYTPSQLSMLQIGDCYNTGTYQDLVNRYCYGQVQDYFQCERDCAKDPETNLLKPNTAYTIPANSRCQYRVFISKKYDKYGYPFTLPIDPSYDSNLHFYVKTSSTGQWQPTTMNYQMAEYSARFLAITNGSYVVLINRAARDLMIQTLNVDTSETSEEGTVPEPPPPPPGSPQKMTRKEYIKSKGFQYSVYTLDQGTFGNYINQRQQEREAQKRNGTFRYSNAFAALKFSMIAVVVTMCQYFY